MVADGLGSLLDPKDAPVGLGSLRAGSLISSAPIPTLETVPIERIRPVQWRLRAPAPIAKLEVFSRTLGLPPKIAAILYARGIHSAEALEPELALSPNPALLEAATRIIAAINAKGCRELSGRVYQFISNPVEKKKGRRAA